MDAPSSASSSPLPRETLHGFRLGFVEKPPAEDLARVLATFRQSPKANRDRLRGRVETTVIALPHLGRVVVKPYARGGLMRFVSRRLHLRSWASRAELEFRMLRDLAAVGIPVPPPLIWAETGTFFVKKWLVTAEIPDTKTFAEIARRDPDRAKSLLPVIETVIRRLISKRVHHVDFHPGNVLVDGCDRAFAIDFDKAAVVPLNPRDLAERYRRRWNRAVTKHGLPATLHLARPPTDSPDPSVTKAWVNKGTQCLALLSSSDLTAFFLAL